MSKSILLFFVFLICEACTPLTIQVGEEQNHIDENVDQYIYLVRHAEKMKDGTSNPPLTPEGEKRALNLSEVLKDKEITKIFSSTYKRTWNTAMPLSEEINVTIEPYDAGSTEEINRMANSTAQNILIVGHGNTVPNMVNLLIGEEAHPQLDESDYGDLYIVSKKGNTYTCTLSRF